MSKDDSEVLKYCIDNPNASRNDIRKKFKIANNRVADILKNVKQKNIKGVSLQSSFTSNGDTANVTIVTEKRIKTLKDLIEAADIDTNIWEIERYTCNKWEVAAASKSSGTLIGFQVQDLWQVKATLVKRKDLISLRESANIILEELKIATVKTPKIAYKKYEDACLFEGDIFDAHIGQLAWGLESGSNYDLKIAKAQYLASVKKLIERIKPYNIERILFPIGNDYLNVNGSNSTTYAGTLQHEDQRWKKTFRTGWQILSEATEMFLTVAPVDITVVAGNHDTEPAFYTGEILSAVYGNNSNVTVDNSPTQRKYYRYGKCMIGFTHGNQEKQADLPLIMANERPRDWNETKFREWHLGHHHHKKEYRFLSANEFKGVTVRTLRALTATDAWHDQKGYIGSQRSAEGFVWNKNEGLICNLSVNV